MILTITFNVKRQLRCWFSMSGAFLKKNTNTPRLLYSQRGSRTVRCTTAQLRASSYSLAQVVTALQDASDLHTTPRSVRIRDAGEITTRIHTTRHDLLLEDREAGNKTASRVVKR